MAEPILIRRAGPEDAEAIAGVLDESFAEYRAVYTLGGFSATALDAQRVLARMNEGPVWVAQCEGRVVGTVAAVVKSGSVYLRGMAVLPAVRGAGAGARLLGVVEQWCREQRLSRIFLSTTPFLHAAIRLYEKRGFRRSEASAQDLHGTPLFTMEKILLEE